MFKAYYRLNNGNMEKSDEWLLDIQVGVDVFRLVVWCP